MKISLLNKVIAIVAVCLSIIAFYHLSTLTELNKEITKSIYHIFHNTIIISLLYFIRSILVKISYTKGQQKAIVRLSIYFFYKIFLNTLYMFKSFRLFMENYTADIFSFMLSSLILTLLLTIKYQKND